MSVCDGNPSRRVNYAVLVGKVHSSVDQLVSRPCPLGALVPAIAWCERLEIHSVRAPEPTQRTARCLVSLRGGKFAAFLGLPRFSSGTNWRFEIAADGNRHQTRRGLARAHPLLPRRFGRECPGCCSLRKPCQETPSPWLPYKILKSHSAPEHFFLVSIWIFDAGHGTAWSGPMVQARQRSSRSFPEKNRPVKARWSSRNK